MEGIEDADTTAVYQSLTDSPGSKATAIVRCGVGQREDTSEMYFALGLLLQDLGAMRAYAAELWESYLWKECALITATVVTNTATDLARSLESDFEETFPQSPGIHKLVTDLCTTRFCDPKYLDQLNSGEMYIVIELFNQTESLFYSTSLIVDQFFCGYAEKCKTGRLGYAILFDVGDCPGQKYNPDVDRKSMSSLEKFSEDSNLFNETASDLCVLMEGEIPKTVSALRLFWRKTD